MAIEVDATKNGVRRTLTDAHRHITRRLGDGWAAYPPRGWTNASPPGNRACATRLRRTLALPKRDTRLCCQEFCKCWFNSIARATALLHIAEMPGWLRITTFSRSPLLHRALSTANKSIERSLFRSGGRYCTPRIKSCPKLAHYKSKARAFLPHLALGLNAYQTNTSVHTAIQRNRALAMLVGVPFLYSLTFIFTRVSDLSRERLTVQTWLPLNPFPMVRVRGARLYYYYYYQ